VPAACFACAVGTRGAGLVALLGWAIGGLSAVVCSLGLGFVVLVALAWGLGGCGGLVDTDPPGVEPEADFPEPIVGEGTVDGTTVDGSAQNACPPAQWDCSGRPVSCDYVENSIGHMQPTISISGACRCDTTRPARPADCGVGDLFVCGALSFTDGPGDGPKTDPNGLRFQPVSCRCSPNAGYYCGHCTQTGLYGSSKDAAGCGLDSGEPTNAVAAVYCGCGE